METQHTDAAEIRGWFLSSAVRFRGKR